MKVRTTFSLLVYLLAGFLFLSVPAAAQQTLGGIVGSLTDPDGSVLPNSTVTLTGDGNGLVRTAKTSPTGAYTFVNLPIGKYTLSFELSGFQKAKYPGITVQADRTQSLNVQMKLGSADTSITVDATPLMNAVDTTVGYVMDKAQIESVPLPTGSFTGLAILSPGVNAEFSGGTGANSGLGNAPIWANGQRDTSNSFLINGVDASNLFNGKSTSQVGSARIVNNTGQGNSAAGGVVPSAASVYLSIGNAIPSPAPETVEEVRVNASMYDAQQGSTSGAHIDLSTKTGSNALHGSAYLHRGTNWLNAAPFFFKKDANIPDAYKNPQLHRYTAGGEVGGSIIKDKLFGYVAYQHLHVSDQETGDELLNVPYGLTDDRSPTALTALANNGWGTVPLNASDWATNPVGLTLFQHPNAPGEPGHYLIPNQTGAASLFSPYDAFLPGTATFISDQLVADVDWNVSSKDSLSLKYYYQRDPATSPYAFSNVPGFTAHTDTGSQVFSVNNAQTLTSNLNVSETLGFIREKVYVSNDQLFGPGDVGMTTSFGNYFPGVTIIDALGYAGPNGEPLGEPTQPTLAIGPNSQSQASNTGMFQNRLMPSANGIWTKGKHTIAFGGSYSYTQLNARDLRTGKGNVTTPDFATFERNWVTPYTTNGFAATTYLQGDANRYYRANQVGLYLQDKFQVTPHLSLTAGVRYDWNGGLTEKNGKIYNFDPASYHYDDASGQALQTGLIIAGNNANGTPGVSKTTLTGRQWGIGPRLGAAWQPGFSDGKVVVRAGMGMYYDRGELFTYLSPGYAAGEIRGGPNGTQQTPPFVTEQNCANNNGNYDVGYYYEEYIPICGSDPLNNVTDGYSLATPWGTTRNPGPVNPKASDVVLPSVSDIANFSAQPYTLGVYNRANKLPYSINFTLNVQWQPRSDMMVEIGYIGNLGRHQVIPLPFNQANIATPSNPTHPGTQAAQSYSYGYTIYDAAHVNNDPSQGPFMANYEGGNIDLRVPYLGYASESESYTAAGVSSYNALQAHFEKRISHGLQASVSYTFSHTTDEQSGMGLFYNGNNPKYLRSGYGSADFDRKHVINFTWAYTLPKFFAETSLKGRIADGWSFQGIGILQSGQPYSMVDYSGAVGSIYYSVFNGITNPIVPLAPGCNAKNAMTGDSGAFYSDTNPSKYHGAAVKSDCFTIPILDPTTAEGKSYGVPSNDFFETKFVDGQRNIFRQAFQKRADASLVKIMKLTSATTLRYTFDVYNLTNTTSLDIPTDNVTQNSFYNNFAKTVSSTADALPTCPAGTSVGGVYGCPDGLGIARHTIGSPRQIQMSLSLLF
ncbi:MAG: TonB-dependent receptor [Acidobacteriaceae bacterium]|nr:TonB-dependent receptor [Acidobacteriaceae bacterium]